MRSGHRVSLMISAPRCSRSCGHLSGDDGLSAVEAGGRFRPTGVVYGKRQARSRRRGRLMKVGIDMGQVSSGQGSWAPGGGAALLDLEELLATRLLVQGNSGS